MLGSEPNRGRILATSFLLFCTGIFLTAYTARRPASGNLLVTITSELLRPLQSLNASLQASISHSWRHYIALTEVQQENDRLRAELIEREGNITMAHSLAGENFHLKRLLGMRRKRFTDSVAARVIGYDPSAWKQMLTIDQGSRSGIQPNSAVMAVGARVVGQVVRVGPSTSHVLLVTDQASGVDAIIEDSRVRGVASGLSDGALGLTGNVASSFGLLFVAHDQAVRVGERVVTSGMDGIFPAGLLIGRVSRVGSQATGASQSIELAPAIDFKKIEWVLVSPAEHSSLGREAP